MKQKTSQVTALNVDDPYNFGNEDKMFAMASAMSKSKYSTSTVVQSKFKSSPSPEQSKLAFSRALHPTPVDNNKFFFGINWNDSSQSQLLFTVHQVLFLSVYAK